MVDSTGRVVGPFNLDGVLFDIGGIYVNVPVTHAGFYTDASAGLYFTSNDCSGPALVSVGGLADALYAINSTNDG